MSARWFRMYGEFWNDPKVQVLSEQMQRRLVMIFCLKCENKLGSDEEIAFALRITLPELQKTKQSFIEKGFVDETWHLKNWNKRQYVSDVSTERVRRFRNGNETFHRPFHDVSETARHKKGNVSASVSVSVSESVLEKQETLRKQNQCSEEDFAVWWAVWSKTRGTAHQGAAVQAFLSVVSTLNLTACIECTSSYLASLDKPNKGYNPQNFLFEFARDGFTSRFPTAGKTTENKAFGALSA